MNQEKEIILTFRASPSLVRALDAAVEKLQERLQSRFRTTTRSEVIRDVIADWLIAGSKLAVEGTSMLSTARVAHSKAVTSDYLAVCANKAGHTLTSLAAQAGCSQALLSQARGGTRSISMELAEKIERLTGFPATKANWPKLRF